MGKVPPLFVGFKDLETGPLYSATYRNDPQHYTNFLALLHHWPTIINIFMMTCFTELTHRSLQGALLIYNANVELITAVPKGRHNSCVVTDMSLQCIGFGAFSGQVKSLKSANICFFWCSFVPFQRHRRCFQTTNQLVGVFDQFVVLVGTRGVVTKATFGFSLIFA